MKGKVKEGEKRKIRAGLRRVVSATLTKRLPRKEMSKLKNTLGVIVMEQLSKMVVERRKTSRKRRAA